jgi:flagellar hook-associated protein 3 FlgL
MTRIANLAANEHLLAIVTRTQSQVQDLQTQVATGKRSQTYAGIAQDTRELLRLERSRQVLERFDRNNDLMKIRLDTTMTAVGEGLILLENLVGVHPR